ncbi:MAG: FAD-dependent oxidoreductase [Planctomycetota bacterium]
MPPPADVSPPASHDAASPTRRRPLVIVGAGMACHALVRRLDELGTLDHYDVTIVGEEPRPCYDRVHLTDYFSGASAEDLLLSPRGWYEARGVRMVTDARVVSLNRGDRTVELEGGDALPYELLVLATGSRPFVPPIEGADLPGVFVYRTIEDLEAIQDYAKGCSSAAVLGGGLLGLEAGKAVYDMGLNAHVIEMAPGLMPRQLNAAAAELLQTEVESLGVEVHTLRRTERIEVDGDRRVLKFAGHDPLTTDMVIISAGIRPRDELARQAGLACGPRGGIAVDGRLRTEDPVVFAIGECVSFDEQLFGLVGPCYEMAETLAGNLAAFATGEPADAEFRGEATASRLKLLGVDVSTLGVPIGEATGAAVLVHQGEGYSRSLLVEDGRLIGAIGVGDWPERERLSGVIATRGRVSTRQTRRFVESGSLWGVGEGASVLEWPASSTICSCLNISRGQLTDAMQAGADTAEKLAESTGASTVCGSCRNLLCDLAGQSEVATGPRGRVGLLIASCLVLLAIPVLLGVGPLPVAETVQSQWRAIDKLWQNDFAKQVTGFSLLGVATVSLLLSLRKRLAWFSLGDFSLWRGVHGMLGAVTVAGFCIHTGLSLGANLTFALAATFLLLNVLGAMTGFAASLESRLTGDWGRRLRAWRPRLTQAHLWLFWPIPALVAFHIVQVYYY